MAKKITDMVEKPEGKKAPAAKKPATKKITKPATITEPIEDAEVVTSDPEVTEPKVAEEAVKKELPKRKPKTILDPAWFQKTVTLALKYKATLMFSADKVWGICQGTGNSCFVVFETNPAWCDALASLFPKGAVFGSDDGSVAGSDLFKKMRAYSKVNLDEESQCYIDNTTGVLHVIGKGIHLKSCTFSELEMAAPEYPKEEPVAFVYADSIPKGMHGLLISAVSKDETRKAMMRVDTYTEESGRKILMGTNGGQVVALPVTDPPEHFNFNPSTVNANDIVGFVCCDNEHDVKANYYRMSDGVMFTEVFGADFDLLRKMPINVLIGGARNFEHAGNVEGEFLKATIESIGSLGLDTGVMQNLVVMRDKKIVFKTESGEVAEYEGEITLNVIPEIMINFSSIREFASFGVSLGINPASPCFAETEDFIYLIMPMKTV